MNPKRTGEIFIEEGIIGREALEAALSEQKRSAGRLGNVLVEMGLVSEEARLRVLGSKLALPIILPGFYPQSPPALARALSPEFLKHYKVVPIEATEDTIRVAVEDPSEAYPLEAISSITGLRPEPVLGSGPDILKAIERYYQSPVTVDKIIEGIDEDEDTDKSLSDVEHLAEAASEAPVINLVNLLISRAVERGASDVHIEPFDENVHVRYRVDGILYLAETLPRRLQPAISSRIKIMSRLNIAERRLPQDGRIKHSVAGREIDIRVSTIPTLYGESVVMRLLDPAGMISLEAVGFNPSNQRAFEALIRQPHGMVLVTGPTGSGKSTTLYAALSRIDTSARKAITIEDPVEYNLEGVNQIQVKPSIGLSFANGLRSIVRQDPDVIMVGEIRDAETADIAVHSALTGHLIFSTLHTNDAPGAITRLMDMGIEGYLISSSLLGVLAQRLVRLICGNCKEPNEADTEALAFFLEGGSAATAYRGAGCPRCNGTGYRGRTGIFELMVITDGIRGLIMERKGSDAIRRRAVEEGMVTLRKDGWDKVRQGLTTVDEVARVTLDDSEGKGAARAL